MDQFLVNEVPVIRLRSTAENLNRGNLVVIYGGTKEANFRFTVAGSLGEKLADLYFNVYCFDFRSNLVADRFYEFGLYDRLCDAREVVQWVLETQKAPLSLMGLSMGGPLAVTIASELGDKIKNLFLVAPAAYHREAMKPEVKFGPQFSEIIRGNGNCSWKETDSFEEAKRVSASTLIVEFRKDETIPHEIPMSYWRNVGGKLRPGQEVRLHTLEGGHTFDAPPQRQEDIIGAIREFLALPPLARD
ncbi:MAG: hypothetical protein G01um10142_499 [Parcubacteria group bacterium Gr01-1014_2]|nr:MAG: hypothetical protein G01um10142_499 [Parcubacteria group bacterium Gr01-1014_2]